MSDPDAHWSVKENSHGKSEYVFGYKLHLLVDCEYELPIAANVTPGNIHDSLRASNLLRARKTYTQFHPDFVMADKAYSSDKLLRTIKRQYRSQPIIDLHPMHKKLIRREEWAMATPQWKALYSQRVAVERVFSRLKGQRSLNNM